MIPKIFHHIWLGNKLIPDQFLKYRLSFMYLHPDWSFMLWTDENIHTLDPLGGTLYNQKLFDAASNLGQKSDILRYEVLFKYGGVYVDFDMECLKRFDDLLSVGDFVGMQRPNEICNAVMGAKRGSVVMHKLMSCATGKWSGAAGSYVLGTDIIAETGQGYIQRMMPILDKFEEQRLHLLDPELFYPFLWDDVGTIREVEGKKNPNSYAAHHWAGSWAK